MKLIHYMERNRKVKPVIYNTFPQWQHLKGVEIVSPCSQGKIHHLLCDENPEIIIDWITFGSTVFSLIYRYGSGWAVAGLDIKDVKELNLQRVVFSPKMDGYLLVDGKRIPVENFARNEGLDEKLLLEKLAEKASKVIYVIHFTSFHY